MSSYCMDTYVSMWKAIERVAEVRHIVKDWQGEIIDRPQYVKRLLQRIGFCVHNCFHLEVVKFLVIDVKGEVRNHRTEM